MKYDTPWSIAPLRYKYYGTEILDVNGDQVMKIWYIPWKDKEGSAPSEREDQIEICDSHYESVASYEIAKMIVEKMNS